MTHLDKEGRAQMVDVGPKPIQARSATASARLVCQPSTLELLRKSGLPKGDALAVARIAGIQAAKRTDELIPLCHSLPLDWVQVDFVLDTSSITIQTTARTSAKTGVEMEALVAAATAALTLYDMLKAVDKTLVIQDVRLVEKTKT